MLAYPTLPEQQKIDLDPSLVESMKGQKRWLSKVPWNDLEGKSEKLNDGIKHIEK